MSPIRKCFNQYRVVVVAAAVARDRDPAEFFWKLFLLERGIVMDLVVRTRFNGGIARGYMQKGTHGTSID
jgi:hypothetical protein